MSGLLARLAGQALGAKAGTVQIPRVRSAMSVHAQVPVAMSGDNEGPSLDTRGVKFQGESQPAPKPHASQPPRTSAHAEPADRPAVSYTPLTTVDVQRVRTSMPRPHADVARPAHETIDSKRESNVPPPLLNEAEPASLAAPAIAPFADPAQFTLRPGLSISSSEPTEVHVHIGRIEITALHESASSRKKNAPAPRQTRSLADYLARRSAS